MDIDWGGQGSASMPSGSYCNNLGTDKCAEITGSGNSTSAMGVPNMGTTFINTIDISELNIKYGGETNYSIHVDKQDAEDSIYMHITGRDGTTDVFSGTDILSASGTASGFKVYENSFEFSGSLTTLIVEIGGRDIGISVGVLFDDVQINVLYNTINTIITQAITSVEMFIALNADASQEIINVVEDVFESNMPIETDVGMTFEPIEIQEPTYAEVEIEIAEIEIAEIELELEIETEIETSIEETVVEEPVTEEATTEKVEVEADTKEEEEQQEEVQEEEEKETNEIEVAKNEEKEPEQIEEQEEKKEETEEEKKEESSKEKAVKKIMKKMDDKKKYDDVNQTKTLVVMQVLGNTKTFFQDQQQLNDRVGFFSNVVLPDTIINDNDMASYFLFVGSDGLMNEMIDSQWQQK